MKDLIISITLISLALIIRMISVDGFSSIENLVWITKELFFVVSIGLGFGLSLSVAATVGLRLKSKWRQGMTK